MRVSGGKAPSTSLGGGGGGGSVTNAAIIAATYTPWLAGTYPVNTFRSYNGKICVVRNPAGTSSVPGATTDAEWYVFVNQGELEKFEFDLDT